MTFQVALWSLSVLGLAWLVWAAFFSPIKRSWAVIGSFCAVIALTFGSYMMILSHPAPMTMGRLLDPVDKYTVIGAHFVEDRGVYMLLLSEGENMEPEYFHMPWNRKMVEQLQKAMREADVNETSVEMVWPKEGSIDPREPMFHALPQPAMPPKQEPESKPETAT